MKRFLALILSILLTISSVPAECFAAELEEEGAVSAVETTEAAEETVPETEAAAEETAPVDPTPHLPAASPRSGGLTEQEPNDSKEKANIIRDGDTISGVMFTDIPSLNLDHADFFKFTVTENCRARIDVIASKKTLFFLVTDSAENPIGEAYSAAFLGKYMYWCNADVVPGTYYIWLGDSDMDYLTYEISLELRGCDHSRNTGVVTAPTCGEQGYTTYTCSDCGEIWTDDYTAATGEHSYRKTVTAPTCGAQGYTTHTCTHCGHTRQDSYTDPTGKHLYSTKVTEPTCISQGYTTYTCTVCGDSWNYNYVEATGEHTSYTSQVTEPTCISQGYTTHTCTDCGCSWNTDYTDVTGNHVHADSTVTEPTCVKPGYTTYVCRDCLYSWQADHTDATGAHSYDHNRDANCNVCGGVRTLGLASGICGAKAQWMLEESGVLQIFGTGAIASYAADAFPWSSFRDQILQVVIGEGITAISDGAFAGCPKLTCVTISKDVTTLGKMVFYNCPELETVDVDPANQKFLCPQGNVLLNNWETTLYWVSPTLSGEYTVPDSIYTIMDGAFAGNRGLTALKIPDFGKIKSRAFENCTALTSITFTSYAGKISEDAFRGVCATVFYPYGSGHWNERLRLDYGGDLTWKGICQNEHRNVSREVLAATCVEPGYTTYTCKTCGFVWVDDHTEATGIHSYDHDRDITCNVCGFVRSAGLASGFCGESVTWVLTEDNTLHIDGTGAADSYVPAEAPWCEYQDQIRQVLVYEGITVLWDGAFAGYPELTKVVLRGQNTQLGVGNFRGCPKLEQVIVSDTNEQYISHSYSALFTAEYASVILVLPTLSGEYTLPEEVQSIADYAFSGNHGLTDITVPEGVTRIGSRAFEDCTEVKTITFTGDAPAIAEDAFRGTSVKIIYPADNETWTAEVRKQYGGSLIWWPLCMESHQSKLIAQVAPTCAKEGFSRYSCDVCGYTWTDDHIPATNRHTYDGSEDSYCNVCGHYREFLASGVCCDSIVWQLDNSGLLTVSGTGPIPDHKYRECCWNGYQKAICKVVIEEGITAIGNNAFRDCSKLTSITIPESVAAIGEYVFCNCVGLKEITIREGITSIGAGAFYGCSSLTSVMIPGSVASISNCVFQKCTSLEEVTIPEGVTSIGTVAFQNCRSLKSVTVPGSVVSIGKNAFQDCVYLKEVTIREGVTSIEEGAFYNCCSLKSVTVPGSVASIADEAFYDCISLETVILSQGVASLGQSVFSGCQSLTSITIPGSVASIEGNSFSGCRNLETVILSEGVASIGRFAFYNMDALKSITIPGSVASIGNQAFHDCDGLETVTISEGVTFIHNYAFYSCDLLETVTIPKSVASIGEKAFSDCDSLKTVTLSEGVASIGEEAFHDCDELETVTIPGTVTSFGTGSFANCDRLENVILSQGLPAIGYGAFSDCVGLRSVTVPESVASIGGYAFAACSSLQAVTIPASVASIGENAFWNCDALESVILPEGVTSIGSNAFSNCDGLKTVVIPGTAATIGSYAFAGDDVLESVTFSDGVASIGTGAFSDCVSLKAVTIPGSLSTINVEAFSGCSNLETVTISQGVTTIYRSAFADCSSLRFLLFPKSIASIGGSAFDGCSSLAGIVFTGEAPKLMKDTFTGVTAIANFPFEHRWSYDLGSYGGDLTWMASCEGSHQPTANAAVAPTCTEAGLSEGESCSVCKMILIPQKKLSALGHTEVVDPSQERTCTQDGLSEGSHCSACGEILIPQEVSPAKGHYEMTLHEKYPTCTEAGLTEGECCIWCYEVLVPQEEIPALGHNEATDPAWEATCVDDGLTEGSHCGRCQQILVPQEKIPALGHSEVIYPQQNPTCTEAGRTESKDCKRCFQILIPPETIPALGHTEAIDPYQAPSCTESGLTEGKHCSVCSLVLIAQKTIPQTAHIVAIDPAREPGCLDGLTEGSHCSVCSEILVPQEILPGKGHNEIVDAAVEATCTSDGLTEGSHCDICGETVIARQVIPALSHRYQVSGATALCSDCGKTVALELQQYLALDLQLVKTAQLHQPEAMSLSWQIEEGGEAVAKVDETGLVTALGAGTAWVIASCKVDENTALTARCRVDVTENPQTERIALGSRKLTVELFSREYVEIPVLLDLPQNRRTPISGSAAIESACFAEEALNRWFTLIPLDDRTLAVVPTAEAMEDPKAVPKSSKGTLLLTVDGEQLVSEEVTLTVKQTKPRLKAGMASFNSFYSGQAQRIQITGATVTNLRSKSLPNWLKLEDGNLILTEDAPLKNTSGKATLLVDTEEWAIPAEVTLTVKNSYKAPGVKLSASTVTFARDTASRGIALQLLPTNKKDSLSALNITGVTAENGYTAENWNSADGTFVLKAPENVTPGKTKLTVHFSDTETLLALTLTVKTEAVKLKLDKTSITLNKAMGDSAVVTVTATPAGTPLTLTEQNLRLTDSRGKEIALSTLQIEAQENRITLKPSYGSGSYKLYVRYGGSKEAVLKIKVISAEASVSFKAKGNPDPIFPDRATVVTPVFKNYMGEFTVANVTAKGNTGRYFRLTREDRNLLVHCEADTPAGTYTLTVKLLLSNGRTCENTLKVTVKPTAVKLKLSAAKLTLNKTIGEAGFVDVSCVTKDYAMAVPVTTLMDKTGKKSAAGELDVNYENGRLTVAVNENTDFGATYKLLVRANSIAPAQTLTVTIPAAAKSAVTASLKLTGKLDVIRPGSVVTVTPGYKNCLSTTEKAEQLRILCSGEDVTHLFVITPNGKGGYTIARANRAGLNAGTAYTVELESTVGNAEPVKAYATFKPTMGSAKVSLEAENTTLFSRDKQDRIPFRILPKDAALSQSVTVEIKDAKYRDVFEIYSYGNGEFALGYKNSRVPDTLIGKTVTVNLNIFLEGNQARKANTTAALKLTILK